LTLPRFGGHDEKPLFYEARGGDMDRVRRSFSREFKVEAVRLVTDRGLSQGQVSRDLDIDRAMLRRWIKQFTSEPLQAFPGKGHVRPDEEELRRLQRENADLREEREILKKALAIFSKQGPK